MRALAKLQKKSCDLVVLNRPEAMHAIDTEVEIIDPSGAAIASLRGPKTAVSRQIFAVIQGRLIDGAT